MSHPSHFTTPSPSKRHPLRTLSRLGVGGLLAYAGVGHLTFVREEFQAQVPDWVPMDDDTVVLLSGVAEIVLGAASADRLFGVVEARRVADGVTVTTDDGSAGTQGWVSDVLPDLIARTGAGVLYGCGPMGMLRSMSAIAADHGIVAQVAVEEAMACGVGICMTCVMPVADAHGTTKMVRSCLEGPVFRGDRVRWDAFEDGLCHVPADAVGAPKEAR